MRARRGVPVGSRGRAGKKQIATYSPKRDRRSPHAPGRPRTAFASAAIDEPSGGDGENRADVPSGLPIPQPSRRKLDHEGCRPREAVVLPVRGAPARPAEASVRGARDPRVAARGGGARTPGANEPLRLVVPDRDVRADAKDEASDDPGLALREGARSRIQRVPSPPEEPPLRREVPVQVDAARVLANAEDGAVRIHVGDDPESDAVGGGHPGEPPRHGHSRALVAVDASDDEDPPSRGRVADDDRTDRAILPRAAHDLGDATRGPASDRARECERENGEDAHRPPYAVPPSSGPSDRVRRSARRTLT